VRLVHNIAPALFPNPLNGGLDQESDSEKGHAQRVAEAEAKLRALAPSEEEARGIITEVEVTDCRDTAEAICSAAKRFGADVICVGGHTRPGFSARYLGSVTLALLQSSRRPVSCRVASSRISENDGASGYQMAPIAGVRCPPVAGERANPLA